VEQKQISVSNPVPVQEDFSMDILEKEDNRKRQDKEVDMTPEILAQLKQEHNLEKAVKPDNLEVPVGLWDAAVCKRDPAPIKKKALTSLQGFMLCLYQRQLWQEARGYLINNHRKDWILEMKRKNQRVAKETDAIRDIIWRAAKNEWFKYPASLRLIFFCFPDCYRTQALRGVRVLFTSKGPTSKKK
jgi:hypothetical protein